MSKPFKPMLASPVDFDKLDYSAGVLVSPKLDGIRCLIIDGVAVTRSLKPIRNRYVQWAIGRPELNGLDGELIVGDPTDHNCYQATNSGVMSGDGEPEFKFYVFDHFGQPDLPYLFTGGGTIKDRVELARQALVDAPPAAMGHLSFLDWLWAENFEDVRAHEEYFLSLGYEGAMLRRPSAPYKFGRASASKKEQHLLKLKQFVDGECRIIGFECMYSNQNEAKKDNLGHTERSTNKEGLVPLDTLGNLIVKDLVNGVEFSIGSGFTAAQRKEVWDSQDDLMGKIVKYKHFAVGVVDKPRFPIFQGFRDMEDMS